MFTSYYAKLHQLPTNLIPVCISRKVPDFFMGKVYHKLAPTWAMLKLSPQEYAKHYKQILSRLNPSQVYDELGGERAVILCYEAPDKSCHRRAVAEWLEESLGIEIPEWGLPRDKALNYWDRFKQIEIPLGRASSNS